MPFFFCYVQREKKKCSFVDEENYNIRFRKKDSIKKYNDK